MLEAYSGDPGIWLPINRGLRDAIVQSAARHTQHYREITAGAATFEDIPLLTKDLVRDRFHTLVAANVALERRIEKVTSGSTGQPLRFFKDLWVGQAEIAALLFLKLQHQVPLDAIEVLLTVHEITEPQFDHQGRPRSNINGLPPTIRIPEQAMIGSEIATQLGVWASLGPYWLHGSGSCLVRLAKDIAEHDIAIPRRPEAAITFGDTTYSAERRLIGEILGCPVNSWYGSHELGGYVAGTVGTADAYACNPWLVYVEVTDETGRCLPLGEPGHLVITDLNNHVMPFIRYETGDMAELSDSTIGGFRVLTTIHGRSATECIRLPSGKLLTPMTFSRVFQNEVVATSVRRWQCQQLASNAIELRIVWAVPPDDQFQALLIQRARRAVDVDTEITIRSVPELEALPSGKRWLVRSM